LFSNGLNIQTFEVVGHSLGAQYAGYFARKIKSKSKSSIIVPRIVGIAPGVFSPEKLKKSDGLFVMTVHTEEFVTDLDVLGHVAFFVNGGIYQPKCDIEFITTINNVFCSHGLSLEYWKEAVKGGSTIFPARQCDSADNYQNGLCNNNAIGYMNAKTSNTLTGKFYLNTFKKSPYAKSTADP
jgi:hypothetical protein